MTDKNNRVSVTIWENKVKNPLIPLWNKVMLGFMGSRFDLNNLIKELNAIKDHINTDMNSKGYALRDVDVSIEFYPEFQAQVYELESFISKDLSEPMTGLAFEAGVKKITGKIYSRESINITPMDATFLFGIKSLAENEKLDTKQFKALVHEAYNNYKGIK